MDGVIADFVKRSIEVCHLPVTSEMIGKWDYFDEYMSAKEFWGYIDNHEGFWENLELFPWSHELVDMCKSYGHVYYASAPALHHNCCEGKIKWLRSHGFMDNNKNEYMFGPEKWLMARRGRVLIDDSPKNIKNFNYAGGNGYLFPQSWNNGNLYVDRVTDVKLFLERTKCSTKTKAIKKKLDLK